MTMKNVILLLILVSVISFFTSLILYAVNRKKYHSLIACFKKEYILPAPYSFHCLTGYFGAAPMAYFFIKLKDHKKILFLERDSLAYQFFDNTTRKLTNWLSPFYYACIMSFACCVLLISLAVFVNIWK